ncbi:hypothetical protein Syn8016DRAFT_2986 [Synechococcus sp. WH 8016]|nr:hypothetical protein Syn8016DRAFT_2986 [Synechococcus sp. WH 8016]
MATRALNSGLWVRRLLIGGSPDQGRCPASEVNDEACPEKPVHLTYEALEHINKIRISRKNNSSQQI